MDVSCVKRKSFCSCLRVGCQQSPYSACAFTGAPVTPSRHSRGGSMEFGGSQVAALRRNSFADAAGSPRMTPRHSRNSSVEALANAAAFVQPYKARILYGGPLDSKPDSIQKDSCLTLHICSTESAMNHVSPSLRCWRIDGVLHCQRMLSPIFSTGCGQPFS